jgi:putative DNA primase/helicase
VTDLDMAANWLATWYRGAPGYIHVSSAGDWNGAALDTVEAALDDVNRRAGQAPQGVYFRVCTLAARPATGKRGGADQSLALPGLWSDNDYGTEGHKHTAGEDRLPLPPDEGSAWAITDRSGLPTPSVVVNSGGGLNCYWLLNEPYIIEDQHRHHVADLSATWQRILGESARKLGFDYGTGVGDLARVLRMPGTDNLKTDTPRPCRVVYETGCVYTIAQLADVAAKLAPAAPAGPRIEAPQRPAVPTPHRTGGVGPFDVLADAARFADILEPAGWSYVGSDTNGERWLRPSDGGAPSSAYSARAYLGGKPVLVVHSENAGLPSGPGCDLTIGRVFAHLNHRGDEREAAQDLIKAAAGDPSASLAARRLPASVLAAIRTQCQVKPWTEPRRLTGGRNYVRTIVRNELQRIVDCKTDGAAQVYRSARAVGRLVGAGLLDRDGVHQALTAATVAAGAPLNDSTVQKAITAGLSAGTAAPFTVPQQGATR